MIINSVTSQFKDDVARLGGAGIGVLCHSDGQIETFAGGRIQPQRLEDIAIQLDALAQQIRRKAGDLGVCLSFPLSAANLISYESPMRTFDLAAAAQFLLVSKSAMIDLAVRGVIPGAKVRRRWVFADEDLERFLRDEIQRQTHARSGLTEEKNVNAQTRKKRRCRPIPSLAIY